MKLKHTIIISSILCIITLNSRATTIDYFTKEDIKFYTLFHNNATNSITCITKDIKGLMWIGSAGGIVQYNGIKIKNYIHEISDSFSLSNNFIEKIFEDSEKNLWFATNDGLNLYNREKDNFKQIKKGLPYKIISDIIEDSKKNLWIVAKFPCIYDRKKGTFEVFTIDLSKNTNENSNNYNKIYEDKKGNIWFTSWKDVYLYDSKNRQFKLFIEGSSLNNKNPIWFLREIIEDKNGNYWLATSRAGLLSFSLKNPKLIQYDYMPTKDSRLSDFTIPDVYIDKKDNIWIGTENAGLFMFNIHQKRFKQFLHDPEQPTSLISNSIWSIYEDNEGRLHFGTFNSGMSIIDPFVEKLPAFRFGKNNKSISNNNIAAFLSDKAGNIWIATDGGGLNYYNTKTKEYKYYKHQTGNINSITKDAVLALCYSNENDLWIGTWEGGINILNTNNNTFKHFNSQNSKLTHDNIFAIATDGNGKMYIGSYGQGLFIHELKDGSWKNYTNDPNDKNSISSNYIFCIYHDSQKQIWVGTLNGGLNKVVNDISGKISFTSFRYNEKDSTGLSDMSVTTIYEGKNKKLWIGSFQGLSCLDLKTQKIKSYRKIKELPSYGILGILEDNNGNLWVSTYAGLAVLNADMKVIKIFKKEDGAQGDLYNRGAALKTNTGHMYFGGTNGFNYFHPDSVMGNPYPPKIIFTDFKIFNKSVNAGEHSVLKKNISVADKITLSYEQSVFTIEFVALNLTNPEKNQYAFKLEGYEKEWNYVGTQKNATYTNLDPGTYTFRVIASNNDNIWNNKGIALMLIITPPYYKTWWFRVSLILTIISILIATYYIRLARIKSSNLLLKKLVEERTSELAQKNWLLMEQAEKLNETNTILEERQQYIEEQAEIISSNNSMLQERQIMLEQQKEELEAQRDKLEELNITKDKLFSILAHDLRTPFNTIIGYTELLYNNLKRYSPEKIEMQVEIIKDAAKNTFYLLNNLLEWSRAQRGVIQPDPSDILISEYLEKELRILMQQAERKNITIKTEITGKEKTIECDPDLLNTVMRNLISNAIKFSSKGGIINVELKFEEKHFTFSVKDNGVGIKTESLNNLFKINSNVSTRGTEGEKGVGLGLILCADFIEKHHGTIWAESQEGIGSSFYFKIPIIFEKNSLYTS